MPAVKIKIPVICRGDLKPGRAFHMVDTYHKPTVYVEKDSDFTNI